MRGLGCVVAVLITGTVPALAERGTLAVDDFAHGRSHLISSRLVRHRRAATVPIGTRRIAVLLVNFADDRSQPLAVDQVAAEMFENADSTNAFLQTQSAGRLSIAGDVFGYFEIAAPGAPCDTALWAEQVNALAAERGIDLAGYEHLLYVHNDTGACDYGGVGELPGSIVFLQASARGAAAHELGHNFGLLHANAYVCQDAAGIATLSADCQSLEYGDQYSMMGGGAMHQLNHWEKVKLGWMDAADIETVTASGTYTIAPASAPSGRRGLHVHRMVDCVSRDYFVEYRTGAPFDTAAPAPGVLVRLAPGDPAVGSRSHLLDMTPATGGGETDHDRELGLTDAALAVGATYLDPEAGVSFQLLAATDDRADIAIQIDDRAPPPAGEGWSPRVAWFADPDLTVPAVISSDPALDFEWGTAAPRSDVPADGFSLRFDGVIAPAADDVYRFVTVSDDGVRLWIDDQLLIDDWQIQAATRTAADLALEGTRAHRVRLEYFDHGGEASLRLGWQRASDGSACQVMTFSAPPPEEPAREADPVAGGCSTSTRPPGLIAALLLLVGLVLVAARAAR